MALGKTKIKSLSFRTSYVSSYVFVHSVDSVPCDRSLFQAALSAVPLFTGRRPYGREWYRRGRSPTGQGERHRRSAPAGDWWKIRTGARLGSVAVEHGQGRARWGDVRRFGSSKTYLFLVDK